MEAEKRYCLRCGEEIPAGSEYCPTCGAALDGTAYDRSESFYRDKTGFGRKESDLGAVPKLMLVYGILAVIVAIVVAFAYTQLDGSWADIAGEDGTYMGMSLDQTSTALMFVAVTMVISGICALAGGHFADRQRNYRLCFALCVVASVVPLFMALGLSALIVWGIILCVIGLIIANRIRNCADGFES